PFNKPKDLSTRCNSITSFPTAPNTFGDAIGRDGFGGKKIRCAIHSRDDGRVSRIERLNKRVLENPSPAGMRTWFKNSPDARPGVTFPHCAQCLVNSGRMMAEGIVKYDAAHFAAILTPRLTA